MKFVSILKHVVILAFLSIATSGVADDSRCGPRCLLVAARASGCDISLAEIDHLLPDFERHVSVAELEMAARKLRLSTLAVRWNDQLPTLAGSTAILPISDREGRRHFVVALQSDGEHVLLLDFPHEPGWLKTSDFVSRWHWDGNALHVAASLSALSQLQPNAFGGWMRILTSVLAVSLMLCFLAVLRSRCSIHHCRPLFPQRTGMSLVEVLVAMSIMGLLISLLAPAIQSSREAARCVECRNHLKQLSLACQAHLASQGKFPAASIPFVSAIGPSNQVNLSVHARLLPFLDKTPLFRKLDQKEDGLGSTDDPPTSSRNPSFIGLRMSLFECPTDRVPAGATNYRVCIGTGPGWWDTGLEPGASKAGAFASTATKSDRDMVDGLSSTVFFSEKLVGDQNTNVYTANRDYFLTPLGTNMVVPADAEVACRLPVGATPTTISYGGASWLFSGYDHTWYNHALPPNASTPDCSAGRSSFQALSGAFTARSLHNGGVHVAFGDGAVKFVGNSVNLAVWRAISSRKGREPVASDF